MTGLTNNGDKRLVSIVEMQLRPDSMRSELLDGRAIEVGEED